MLEGKGDVHDMLWNVEEAQEFSFYYKNALDFLFIKRKRHISTASMSIRMAKRLDSEEDHFILIMEGTSCFINCGLGI